MKLRFFARGAALVSDFDALDRSPPLRRFIGRKYQEVNPGEWGFVPTSEPDDVRLRPEIVKAARDGELWAADESTAKACGIRFDPQFGGELPAREPSKKIDQPKEKV